jgi:tetratricopeptide (TPR) repeat protein
LQGAILDQLNTRKKLTVPQLIYLGDASVALSKNDKAREIYQRVLTEVDQDPAAKATAGAATTRIRARLVGLLRNEGKLDEAKKQVDAILQAHPNALEPLMEKGYILQNLAERDPRRWDECIKHWSDLRVRLESSKPRPNEYYDVLYNAALSLVRQARQTNNKEKAILAEKMLKSSLILTPRLNGPDTVAKYEALLTAAASLRGPVASPPAPAPPAVPAPGKK